MVGYGVWWSLIALTWVALSLLWLNTYHMNGKRRYAYFVILSSMAAIGSFVVAGMFFLDA